jgi:Carboxypeptidase regulatory-like domain
MSARILQIGRSIFKLLAVVLASLALLVSVVPAAHAESTSTVLSGTVRTFLGAPAGYAQVCAVSTADGSDSCVYADDMGAYELTLLPDWGSVRLLATLNGLPPTYYGSSGSTNDEAAATIIVISEGDTTSGLDITFTAATGITGSVALSDAGAAEIQVSACAGWSDDDSWDCSSTSVLAPDASTFTIEGLGAGTYRVTFWAAGYGSTFVDATVVQDEVATLEPITLAKLEPGALSGTVVGTDGEPIVGVSVTASSQGATELTTTTDDHGSYSFTAMPSGIWWDLEFVKTGYAPGNDGAQVEPGQAVDLGATHLARAASLSVHVQNTDAQPVSSANLRLCGGDNGNEDCVWGTELSDGDYAFAEVGPGSYVLHASHDDYVEGFYPGVKRIADASLIRIAEGDTVELSEFTVVHPASLSGAVTYASDGAATNARASLYDSAGAEIDNVYAYESNAGTFEFSGLWPGSYTVKATSWEGFGTSWMGGSSDFDGATRISLSEAESATGANVVFADDVVLTGSVTAAGSPVSGADIYLDSITDPDLAVRAASNADGAYSVRLLAGTYSISVSVGSTQVCGPGYSRQCVAENFTASASNKVLDLALPADSGTLSGAIAASASTTTFWASLLDASDSSVASTAWDADEQEPIPTSYSFDRVPFGDYTLVVAMSFGGQRYPIEQRIPITIDGASVVRDLSLTAAPRVISGTVTAAHAEDWVEVRAINAQSGTIWSTVLEDVSAGPADYSLGVEPGTYKLLVSTGETDVWYPAASTMADAQSVTVPEDADAADIDVTLPQTRFTVTGSLILPDGITAAQAQQNLYVWFAAPEVVSENTDADTYAATLDDSGHYSVDLPAGSYRGHVEASTALGTLPIAGESFRVPVDQAGPDITVVKGGSLAGRVVAADGVAVSNAEITVTGSDGISSQTYSDRLGYWRLDGVAPGTATVKALATGYVSGAASPSPTVVVGERANVATITLTQAGRLYVVAPEDGFSWIGVVVTDAAGTTLREATLFDGDGPTLIDNVPVGTVKVRFEGDQLATEWWKDATSVSTATPITLDAATAVTLVPTLSPRSSASTQYGTLSGHIDNTSGTSGHLSVMATSDDDGTSYQADADTNGDYQLRVPVGSYTAEATLCLGFWVSLDNPQVNSDLAYCVGGRQIITRENSVQIAADETSSGIDFTFDPAQFTGTPTPTISGATAGGSQVGDVLTAGVSGWSPAPDQFTYQWLRDGENIDGATSATYTLAETDRATAVSVKVTAIRSGYESVTKTSATLQGPDGATFTTTPTPTITGDAKLDSVLTADAGTWDPVADKLVYTWYAGSTQIAEGENLTSYTLTTDEVGKTITVKVTGSKAGYDSVTTESSATAAVTAETLTYTQPTISGTARFGEVLSVTAGAWTDQATLAYQWNRGADEIPGATESTYTLVAADVGKAISVTVTGTKTGYLSHAESSAATDPVAALTMTSAKPQITGVAKVGVKLTATVTGWDPTDAQLSYAWAANGVAIAGATANTFTPTQAQLGKAISVTVTGTKPGYEQASATSDQTAAVMTDRIIGSTPRLSGTAKVGYRLTATAGTWTPTGVALSYQWYASGAAVSGATGPSFLLTPAQLGKAMSVTITGTASGYSSVSMPSARTAAVAAGSLSAKIPVISGKAKVGKTVKAVPGTWGPAPVTLRYQWYANGTKISKATKSSYKIAKKYKGKKITVAVTGVKSGYTTVTKKSKATSKVKA